MDSKYTAEEIASFRAMKRDDIYALLAGVSPESVKGKSRAKKDDLIAILEGLKKDTHTAAADKMFGDTPPLLPTPPRDTSWDLETTKPYPSMELAGPLMVVHDASPAEVRLANQPTMNLPLVSTGVDPQPHGRRSIVVDKLSVLSADQRALLARYSRIPDGNRMMRRMRDSLARRIRRFLPADVALYEAEAVV